MNFKLLQNSEVNFFITSTFVTFYVEGQQYVFPAVIYTWAFCLTGKLLQDCIQGPMLLQDWITRDCPKTSYSIVNR